MFVHCVYFWLKPGLTDAEEEAFYKGVSALTSLDSVRHGWVGKPATTDRPVIDTTYSYGLVVAFDDLSGHDAYQIDPVHDHFRETCAQYWSQVKIYDFES